ncbi:MAG: hypothetical protein ABMA25_27900, partial [Ilumatobacteraceae bacterium]
MQRMVKGSRVLAAIAVAILPMVVVAPATVSADSAGGATVRMAGSGNRLAGSDTHTCEILDDGSLTCWGSGLGALGYGNTDTIGDDELPADAANGGLVQLPGGEAAVQVDAGIGFT